MTPRSVLGLYRLLVLPTSRATAGPGSSPVTVVASPSPATSITAAAATTVLSTATATEVSTSFTLVPASLALHLMESIIGGRRTRLRLVGISNHVPNSNYRILLTAATGSGWSSAQDLVLLAGGAALTGCS